MSNLNALREEIAETRSAWIASISISSATCGRASGSLPIAEAFAKTIHDMKLEGIVRIIVSGCHGFCAAEPNVIIFPDKVFYRNLEPTDVEEIVTETIVGNRIVDRLVCTNGDGDTYPYLQDVPFYKKQVRIVTGDNPHIDPTDINDYLVLGGYGALEKALTSMSPDEVIEQVKKARLRGRGGAGFPTGFKWDFCRRARGDVKYLICNADEGDPGAYMDRSLLEGNPHAVIEGMLLAAYAIGAREGWLYVRAEYPLAVSHVTTAIDQAHSLGLLGENILGSSFSFDLRIIKGAGAFVCGEETALINSIEGGRGVPRQRPPFPVVKGLWGKPTVINNVETLATVPKIVDGGANWFTDVGTETSKGTKIFSLVGKIRNTGLVEVPMGITLREIAYDIGGGAPEGRQIKAIQTGGPSGGCIPAKLFDIPVDYESLTTVGSIMGSGGMIVMDERTCMVDVARYFTNFLQDESCGKCVTCREGTQRMYEILCDMTEGKGTAEGLSTLEELGNVVRDTSLCGLGQTASNPMLSTLRYFKNEYVEHIYNKRCSASVCKEIVSAPCQHTCPIGQEAAVYIALVARGDLNEALRIIKKDNPLASVLSRVCHHPCEAKCRAGDEGDPISIRGLKRLVTDYGLQTGRTPTVRTAKRKPDGKIAIIGSGPAGLTCAYFLATRGFMPTIFEKLPVAGGMLAVAIPEYRLPRNALQADIDYITSAGVEIRTNCGLGDDVTLKSLADDGYRAVFIATGAHKSMRLGIPGEDTGGVLTGMEVLTSINLGSNPDIGSKVGVIGGGNTAIDAARAILRTGLSDTVTVFYRRTRKEMPAFAGEVDAALEEGIRINFLVAPSKIVSEGGSLLACEFKRMELGEPDPSGRRRPVPVEGSEFVVELDTLVAAIGERPNTSFLEQEAELQFSGWGTLVVDAETLLTARQGLFAGGDLVTGPGTVVEACAAGKMAAESIDRYLTGRDLKRPYEVTRPSEYVEPVQATDEELELLLTARRPSMPHLALEERIMSRGEVELGLTADQATSEARRCLRCDLETEDGRRFLEQLKASGTS
jgi:NADH-quinone oxidoreductase subunit F